MTNDINIDIIKFEFVNLKMWNWIENSKFSIVNTLHLKWI